MISDVKQTKSPAEAVLLLQKRGILPASLSIDCEPWGDVSLAMREAYEKTGQRYYRLHELAELLGTCGGA